jgi:methionyl-tRNA formyltransferase
MKTLLILGADSAASWLGYRILLEKLENVHIFVDTSNNLVRIIRLLWKGRLKTITLIRLVVAEILRSSKPFEFNGKISSNAELIDLIRETNPDQVLCFRCGLIINRTVIETGVPIFNIHVSSLPEFPGLGTIDKSIKAKAWEQYACLHRIDEGIDTGQILMRRQYFLSSDFSYKKNEDIAYTAGVELAMEYLQKERFSEI